MPRKIRFSGFASGSSVSLSASQGGVSRGQVSISAWKAAPDLPVTVTRYPAGNVFPGEVITFMVTDVPGYSGDIQKLDFVWDFGDPGAAFEVAQNIRSTNANTEFGMVVAHAYETLGSKDVSVDVYDNGVKIGTQIIPSFTVEDSDSYPWNFDLWLDFGEVSGTPDFTDAPDDHEVGAVRYLDKLRSGGTYPGLGAYWTQQGNSARNKVRINLKKGETFTWDDQQYPAQGRIYVRSVDGWGTGARPKIVGGGVEGLAAPGLKLFGLNSYSGEGNEFERFAVYGVDFEGGYNPLTGGYAPGTGRVAVYGEDHSFNGGARPYRSFFKCEAKGMWSFYQSQGSYNDLANDERTYLSVSDCNITDWYNYGLGQFGSRAIVAVTGSSIHQNPLTLLRDGKDGLIGAPDHGPMRIQPAEFVGITNCFLASSSGWSGRGADHAIQPCIRIHFPYMKNGSTKPSFDVIWPVTTINIQRCDSVGAGFMSWGRNNSEDSGYYPRTIAQIQRNHHVNGRQHSSFVSGRVMGVYARNNLVEVMDMFTPGSGGAGGGTNFFATNFPDTEFWGFDPELLNDPYEVDFNTLISHRTVAGMGVSDDFVISASDKITLSNNIGSGPEHPNGGDWNDGVRLDRSNNFRPATGSAAIGAVTTGDFPSFDFDGNLRALPTNEGAHHSTSEAAVPVDPPVNLSPPRIGELDAFPGEYRITDFGEWENWGDLDPRNHYLVEWSWRIDGTPVTNDHLTTFDASGQTGNLTCVLTVTNRSGLRVNATSEPVAL